MVPQESIPKYELTYNCRIMTNSRLVRSRQMSGSKPAHRQKTPPPPHPHKYFWIGQGKKDKKKRLSSDTEVGKFLDRWRIRNFLEPLVLCSSTHWFQYQISAYPIISKKINIPGSHIIMLYDVSSNAQDEYFLTARFTRFRAFSIALF